MPVIVTFEQGRRRSMSDETSVMSEIANGKLTR